MKPKKYRNSCPDVFCKKDVLKNFPKFTGKQHLCQSFFFAGPRAATLFKRKLWRRCFPVNFATFLRAPFSIAQLRWLLLEIIKKYEELWSKIRDLISLITRNFR